MQDFLWSILSNFVASVLVLFVVLPAIGYITFAGVRSFFRVIGFAWRMHRSGVINFYTSRHEYHTARRETLEDYIGSAKKEFLYVGFYLAGATDTSRLDESFRRILDRGCKVTLVLLSDNLDAPIREFLEEHLAIAADTLVPRIQHAHEHFADFATTLSAPSRALFTVKRHQVPLSSSAMFIDFDEKGGRLLVDCKAYGEGRDNSFGLEVKPQDGSSSLSAVLARSFRRIAEGAV
jgi:hypothetical protein